MSPISMEWIETCGAFNRGIKVKPLEDLYEALEYEKCGKCRRIVLLRLTKKIMSIQRRATLRGLMRHFPAMRPRRRVIR